MTNPLISARLAGLKAESEALERLAADAADPENAAALAAAAAGSEPDSEGRRFAQQSAEQMAALPSGEFNRGLKAMRAEGLL